MGQVKNPMFQQQSAVTAQQGNTLLELAHLLVLSVPLERSLQFQASEIVTTAHSGKLQRLLVSLCAPIVTQDGMRPDKGWIHALSARLVPTHGI